MKKLVFGSLFMLFCLISCGQEPPKFAEKIIVKGTSFNQVKSTLLDSGFFIEQQNEQDGTIVTKPKNADDYVSSIGGINTERWLMIFYIRIKDSVATFSEQFNNNAETFGGKKTDWTPMVFWKHKANAFHITFCKMDNIAKALNGQVAYVVSR